MTTVLLNEASGAQVEVEMITFKIADNGTLILNDSNNVHIFASGIWPEAFTGERKAKPVLATWSGTLAWKELDDES